MRPILRVKTVEMVHGHLQCGLRKQEGADRSGLDCLDHILLHPISLSENSSIDKNLRAENQVETGKCIQAWLFCPKFAERTQKERQRIASLCISSFYLPLCLCDIGRR